MPSRTCVVFSSWSLCKGKGKDVIRCTLMGCTSPTALLFFLVYHCFESCVSRSVFPRIGGYVLVQVELTTCCLGANIWNILCLLMRHKNYMLSLLHIKKKSKFFFNWFLQVAFFWDCSLRLPSIPADEIGKYWNQIPLL